SYRVDPDRRPRDSPLFGFSRKVEMRPAPRPLETGRTNPTGEFSTMASGALSAALTHLREIFRGRTTPALNDAQLLGRYLCSRGGEAFEAILARHGPMVVATCREILRGEHDVEDAFQATFLVLARKASTIRERECLAAWLHRVACRIAVQMS